ncbi:TIGR03013 family XrtA/PEP-CTERM system glycosyltransferase [Chitinivorax sp. PXF-14]|uniref:TIGR03013 family XrtA/PEP-CTERM system glycosyltransferase n=1 Tax=Chitinivorax sp. PXF-14 TaxID=3230488 RepID=UPI0034675BFA
MLRIFNHYIPVATLALLLVELLVIGVSIYVVEYMPWRDLGVIGMHQLLPPIFPKAAFIAIVMVTIMAACGLYQSDFVGGIREIAVRLFIAFAAAGVLMTLLVYWLEAMRFGAREMFWSILVAMLAVALVRLLFFKWTNIGVFKPRVLVLGTGSRAVKVDEVAQQRFGGGNLDIVGYMPPLAAAPHAVAASRILPQEDSLVEAVQRYGINEIVIAIRDRRGGNLPVHELLECRMMGVRVLELSTFFERECGQVKLDSLNASWMVFNEGFNQSASRDVVKRAFDLLSSLLLLLITSPVILLTALAIKIEDGGPVLYSQERVGQNDAVFTIFKFRSMRVDSEKDGKPRWALTNDDRITRVGRIIRKLRIDELPQVLNVLKGDMSFVGPRPERPYFVQKLEGEIPYYSVRHCMKPGITGWAQVRYAYGATVDDAIEKLQYDLYYVKNHSLFLDVLILIETIQVVLWGKGAR